MNKKSKIKLIIFIVFLILASVSLYFLYFNNQEAIIINDEEEKIIINEKIEKLEDNNYYLNKEESQFIWQASRKTVNSYVNKGSVDFSSGYFILEDNKIIEGEFIFDMETLRVTDMSNFDSKIDLENHLKSEDFFNVSEYNQSILTIKEGSLSLLDDAGLLYEVLADLEIKGITNEIDFYVMLYRKGDKNIAEASLELDRTLWDIKYGSDKFFDLLADETIDDIFKVNLSLLFN